ncbi:MAG: RagB/SusD family nutrient uptake outer membrane protein [Chitinophagaceae bacterium]|nr:RagB/SusD family nutrient uptake outer membrane protein [Chitinophagaceae bacterium]
MQKHINIKILLTGIVLMICITACKRSFLDVTNPNRQTEATFWNSESDVMGALASAYSPLRTPLRSYWGGFTGFQNINSLGDDILTIPGDEPPTWQIASFINDPVNSDAASTFGRMYNSIYRANQVIANTPKAGMDDAKKTQCIAEAKFLRGLAYFVLASTYGDVPLRLEPALTTDQQYIPSSPVSEVWKAVENDFSDAVAVLPAARPAAEAGRAGSGAALAFLGKAYLYQGKYDLAETTLAKLTTAPYSYGLLSDFDDNFTAKNELNQEDVFRWVYGDFGNMYGPWTEEAANSPMHNYIAQFVGPVGGGGWFKYVPSAFIVSEFLKEPRPEGSDTKFDKRTYTSFFWKRSEFGEADVTWYGGMDFESLWATCRTKVERFYPIYNYDTVTHGRFLIRKFTNAWENIANADNYWGPKPSTANYVIMRYAEVLLNLAEAQIKNNNLDAALSNINLIRRRAGLPDKTASDLPDATAVMNELMHQKVLELFFEQNRWNDLKRWYTPEQLKQLFIINKKQGAENLQAKHYVFPIPTSEINTNNKLKQNPLWQ